jgi:cell wall-associated NlpC family hydrolase
LKAIQFCKKTIFLMAVAFLPAYVAVADDEDKQSSRQDIVMYALGLSGIDYKYGGNSPDTGLDCSGFVRHVFLHIAHKDLPRNAYAMSHVGEIIEMSDLEPGDLVFFNTLHRRFSHVGIYVGEDRFIHAPSSGAQIAISSMKERYWSHRFDGARRILAASSTPVSTSASNFRSPVSE